MAVHDDDPPDPFADPEERRVLYAALDSFRQYRQAAHYNITHLRRQSFYSLPGSHVDCLSEPPFRLPELFDDIDRAIDSNADISEAILEVGLASFGIDQNDETWEGCATLTDLDKARSTIRQLYRDWSAEGRPERDASNARIIAALGTHLPSTDPGSRHQYAVLVPGAGLGRLVLDICCDGYTVEGNEISYHQIFASNYMLNYTQTAGQHTLFPWALRFSNHRKRERQMHSVLVPDINPHLELDTLSRRHGIPEDVGPRMSMSAGDFSEVYRRADYQDTFNAVTTCFFIDTAPNVINYIETVKNCLKPGGIWVNLGPLLWHFESTPTPSEQEEILHTKTTDNSLRPKRSDRHARGAASEGIGDPGSFELSNEEVIALLARYGFQIIEQEDIPSEPMGYITDRESMLQNLYFPAFWVARKI